MPKKAGKQPEGSRALPSPRAAATAVQFTQRLSERRAARHGTTLAESQALHEGLSDDQFDLPFAAWDDLSEEQEQLMAAEAAEMGMGASSPLADEDMRMFGIRLLNRREASMREKEAQLLPIGSAQLDMLGMLERTATAPRVDGEIVTEDDAMLLPTVSIPMLTPTLSALAGIKPPSPPSPPPPEPLPGKRAKRQRAPPPEAGRPTVTAQPVPPTPAGTPPQLWHKAAEEMREEVLQRQTSAPVVFISFKDRSIELRRSELKQCPNIPAMLRKKLRVPARGKLTLKTQVLVDSAVPPVGIEVPITGELPARKYILDTGPEYTLHFLQEPPHGVAHWLQCWAVGPKSDLSLTHTFTPPVEMTVLHNGDMMDPKDACKLLEKGIKWRLLRDNDGEIIDVTEKDIKSKGATEFELIKQSKNVLANLQPPANQRQGEVGIRNHEGRKVGSVLFKGLGIAGVSAKYRTSAEVKAAKKQAEEQGAAANAAAAKSGQKSKKKKSIAAAVSLSGRVASDYFLLEASLDGVPAEILRDHSTGEYAQICIKNHRLKTKVKETIGWEEQGIGPYADHSLCVPSHICELGRPKCCPMPQTAAGRAATAAAKRAATAAAAKPTAKAKRKTPTADARAPTERVPAPLSDDGARVTRTRSAKMQKVDPAQLTRESSKLTRASSKRDVPPAGALGRQSSTRTHSNRQWV